MIESSEGKKKKRIRKRVKRVAAEAAMSVSASTSTTKSSTSTTTTPTKSEETMEASLFSPRPVKVQSNSLHSFCFLVIEIYSFIPFVSNQTLV
jgi:hypothetical protein